MENLITHNLEEIHDFDGVYEKIQKRILAGGDSAAGTVQEKLQLLEDLSGDQIGREILLNRGFSGSCIELFMKTMDSHEKLEKSELFVNIFAASPMAEARHQRLGNIHLVAQEKVVDGCRLLSAPSGHMRDLLQLDYSGIEAFSLVASDLDPASLHQAAELALQLGLAGHLETRQENIYDLQDDAQFDLISNIGFTSYEPDDAKVTRLYGQLCKALKPGGVLLTSNTVSPAEWSGEVSEEGKRMYLRLSEVVQPRWENHRSVDWVVAALKQAGFTSIDVIFDTKRFFPLYKAIK